VDISQDLSDKIAAYGRVEFERGLSMASLARMEFYQPLGLVLLLLTHAASSNAQVEIEKTVRFTHAISCDIEIEHPEWNRTVEDVVLVRTKNLTHDPLGVEVMPVLYLSSRTSSGVDGRFWAPVDLFHNGPLTTERGAKENGETITPRRIRLQFRDQGEVLTFRIDARNALWDREISSFWPSHKLFSFVKTGIYELRMELETSDGIAKSKEVTIHIDSR
jgi:hypothetical protein